MRQPRGDGRGAPPVTPSGARQPRSSGELHGEGRGQGCSHALGSLAHSQGARQAPGSAHLPGHPLPAHLAPAPSPGAARPSASPCPPSLRARPRPARPGAPSPPRPARAQAVPAAEPPAAAALTHVNTKNRVLEPTSSAAAVATGMYLAGLRRVPGLRGILGAAPPPHPSPGPGRAGPAGSGRVGAGGLDARRRTRGGGGGGGGNPTPRAAAAAAR